MANIDDLREERRRLREQLTNVEQRILEQKHRDKMNQEEYRVYMRMLQTGDYIVNINGRLWWVNDGDLQEAASSSEFQACLALVRKKIVEHATKHVTI